MSSVISNHQMPLFASNNSSSSSSSHAPKFIAVSGEAAELAGAVVYFRTTETAQSSLLGACRGAGLDEEKLPELPSNEVALRRAVDALKSRRRLVRPVDGGGWSIVDEETGDDGQPVAWNVAITVNVDEHGALAFLPLGHSLEQEIRVEYHRQKTSYAAADISAWLVRLCDRMKAVSLRDRGGVYFVPRQTLEAFKRWVEVLHSGSGARVFFVPAIPSDEAIETILDAITREAESEAESMEAELEVLTDADSANSAEAAESAEAAATSSKKALGKRAIRTRLSKLSALGNKLGVYEELLGTKLDVLRDRLEKVRVGMTLATLMTEEEG